MLKNLGRVNRSRTPEEGVPPGQFVTEKFPVLTFGSAPHIDRSEWRMKAWGLVAAETVLNWDEFTALGRVKLEAEFHCVTQWSRLVNTWEGVPIRAVLDAVQPLPEAKFVMVHCYGGYSTNIALNVLDDDDVLFAYRHDDGELAREHGGPLRLVVPKRYGWKSAKWVNGLEFLSEDTAGFWEVRGYHMEGDPWLEQRFRDDLRY
jgi:DMSO/TMAO reductase YedYZ molybdopterin-dependent catalytic subunit